MIGRIDVEWAGGGIGDDRVGTGQGLKGGIYLPFEAQKPDDHGIGKFEMETEERSGH